MKSKHKNIRSKFKRLKKKYKTRKPIKIKKNKKTHKIKKGGSVLTLENLFNSIDLTPNSKLNYAELIFNDYINKYKNLKTGNVKIGNVEIKINENLTDQTLKKLLKVDISNHYEDLKQLII